MQLMSALPDNALIISESDHENEVFKLTLDKDDAIATANFKLFFIKGVIAGKEPPDAMTCEKAAALYQRVGKLGHSGALYNVAWLYAHGRAGTDLPDQVARDKKAVECYQQAIALGHAGALCNLAWLYAEGRAGTDLLDQAARDSKAVEYYQQAVELGDAQAMTNLGWLYTKGRAGTDLPDQAARDRKAVEYYQRAAGLGHAGALCNLGLYYVSSRAGTDLPDQAARDSKAVAYYQQAMDLGDEDGMDHLDWLYERNRVTEKALVDVVRCYARVFKVTRSDKAKENLQKIANNNKSHAAIQYLASILLDENNRDKKIKTLIASSPGAILRCLIEDSDANSAKKQTYLEDIETNYLSRLSTSDKRIVVALHFKLGHIHELGRKPAEFFLMVAKGFNRCRNDNT